MLLWASKFTTAKIECNFEMGKLTPLGVTSIMLGIVPYKFYYNKKLSVFHIYSPQLLF